MKAFVSIKYFLALFVIFSVVSGCASAPESVTEPIVKPSLTYQTWSTMVPTDPVVVVLFDKSTTSKLTQEFNKVEKDAPAGIVFYKFSYTNESLDANFNKTEPSIHLYRDGSLIDQIVGTPTGYEETTALERDMALWTRRTVQPLVNKNGSKIVYKFNGSTVLDIRAY